MKQKSLHVVHLHKDNVGFNPIFIFASSDYVCVVLFFKETISKMNEILFTDLAEVYSHTYPLFNVPIHIFCVVPLAYIVGIT